jgi:AcrR family transcriptional regulator
VTLPTAPGCGPQGRTPARLLPIIGQEPELEERSDAARNRTLLLDAAARLVAEQGVAALTMDELARRVGVGKGTVFRRFGSRAGLMVALLNHSEEEFQSAYMFGPPPLGPGADPVERLVAFGRERLNLMELQGDMKVAGGVMLYSTPAYQTDVTHVATLLRQAETPGDLRLLAQMLLNTIEASLVLHQTRAAGIPLGRLADLWELVVRRIAGPDVTGKR